jgi:hypothetical protein
MTTALEALAQLSHQEPTPEYFVAFHEEVNAEKNHRGAAILLASNIEVSLRYAIARLLVTVDDSYKTLFRTSAPLSSFNAKIRFGYAIGLYKEQTTENLDRIRGIRNAFAHAVIPITFDTPEVSKVCGEMTMPEILPPRAFNASTMEAIGAMPKNPTSRERFQKICEAISHNIFVVGMKISPSRTFNTPLP